MRISLVITTYNWPEALNASIRSVFRQSVHPYEIIIADDGSGAATKDIIENLTEAAQKINIKMIHSWQRDLGFRLARSRNKAIAKTSGNYIVLIDGDIVLENHFIEDHQLYARAGFFNQGTRVLLGKSISQQVIKMQKKNLSIFSPDIKNKKNCLRLPILGRFFSFRCTKIHGVKTCNFAFWKKDAIRINGFNEEFVGWGREDSEFTARLLNIGVKRCNVKFSALGYHLYHPMNNRRRLSINEGILQKTIMEKRVWCPVGIDQHL
ncbi:MAG: family 2 glycosyl transferase [Desulfobulbus propionicus]|nr:MAG: family 2 glycosyl transferase [Desulfobulbus propionicus]